MLRSFSVLRRFFVVALVALSATAAHAAISPGDLVIREFRLRGTSATDEYVEIANRTGSDITVAATDASAGFGIVAQNAGACPTGTTQLLATIPNGTVIPAGGAYLTAHNAGYSLSGYGGAGAAAPNATWTVDVCDGSGVGLFSSSTTFDGGTALDRVSFATFSAIPFIEGPGLPATWGAIAAPGQYAFLRKAPYRTGGAVQDTNENDADFYFISIDAGVYSTVQSALGTPGPQKLASPVTSFLTTALADPAAGANSTPNRIQSGNYHYFRRMITNNTGAPIAKLRFRIADISTLFGDGYNPALQADWRGIDTTDIVITLTDTTTPTAKGLTVEAPTVAFSAVGKGAGYNASATVNLGGTLADNASVFVNIGMRQVKGGPFYFLLMPESSGVLPNAAPVVTTSGGTTAFVEDAGSVAVDGALTVADDGGTLDSATVTIANLLDSGVETLSATPAGTILAGDIVYAAPTLTITRAGATVADYETVLRSVRYDNTSNTPTTTARTVNFVGNDGSLSSTAASKTVSVAVADDPPVATPTGGSTAFTEDGGAVVVDSGVTLIDPDSPSVASVKVLVTNIQDGTAEILTATPFGVITAGDFSGGVGVTLQITHPGAPLSDYEAVLRSVRYNNTSQNPNTTPRIIRFDPAGGVFGNKTLTVAAVNDAPVLATSSILNYTENQAAAVINGAITISDVDNTTFASAAVSITTNFATAEDALSFTNAAMGNIAGSYAPVTGVMTLTSAGSTATLAQWQLALRAVKYANSSENPSTLARLVTYVINDGTTNSNVVLSTINVAAVNDLATVTTTGGASAFTEDAGAIVVDSGLIVADVDNTTLSVATVTITNLLDAGAELLTATPSGAITAGNIAYAAPTLTITHAGGSLADFEAVLKSVTYNNTSQNPTTTARVIAYRANDGGGLGPAGNKTVTVTAVNDAPVIALVAAGISFTEGNAFTTLDSNLTVSDVDNANLTGATVTISANVSSDDVLACPACPGQGITQNFTSPTLSLSGNVTKAAYQTALRSVTYGNASQNPTTPTRTITWQVNDGSALNNLSNQPTSTVAVTAVNDAPVALAKTSAVTANMKRVGIDASLLLGATDADNGVNGCTSTLSVASIGAGAGGTVSNVNLGAGTFDFDPVPGFTGSATVPYTIADDGCPAPGATSSPATITITVSGPVIWFVDNAVTGPGDGRLSNPFKTLAGADAVDATGQGIFLVSGTYATGIALNSNELLIGQGVSTVSNAGFTSFDAVFGISPPAGTVSRPSIAGTRPTVQGTVTLNATTVVRGLNISSSGSTGMNDPVASIASVAVTEVAVSTSTASAVVLSDVTSSGFTFNGVTTGGGAGVSLTGTNTSSIFTFTGLSVSSGANNGFVATGGGTVTVAGTGNTLTSTTGTALNVANTTIGGSGLTFQSISAGTGAGGPANGIILNNTGAVGLTVTGDAGSANNGSGGTIQKCTASAIALTSTQNVSFDQMNIQNSTRSAINGTSVTNFTFTNGTANACGTQNRDACIAFNTTNFAGAQTQNGNNISGTLTITGNMLSNGFLAGIDTDSDSGTITNANVSNNTVTNSSATAGTAAISFVGTGNASTSASLLNATINQNTVTNAGAGGIQVSYSNGNAGGPGATTGIPGDGTKVVSITNNSVSLVGATGTNAIIVSNSGANSASRTRTNFVVTGNGRTAGLGGTAPGTLGSSNIGTSILIGNNGFSTMTGTVDNNVIAATHTPNFGGGNGIAGGNGVGGAGTAWTPQLSLIVSNNTISGTDGNGILLVNRATNGEADIKINNNNVGAPNNPGGSTRQGIRVDAGNNTAGEDASVFLNIFGNTSAGSNGGSGIGIRKQGSVSTTNDFGIFDAAGGPSLAASPTNTDITNFINALNPGSATGSPDAFGTGGTNIISGSNYQRDTTQAPPLMFAAGGVNRGRDLTSSSEDLLTQADLDSVVGRAVRRWTAAGLTIEQMTTLRSLSFGLAQLPASYLGDASGDGIRMDRNAAGNSWFVGSAADEDSQFGHEVSATLRRADPTGAPAGRVDLLTAIMHEMGHAIGLEDTYAEADRDDVMYGYLTKGERRVPRLGQANPAKPVSP